MMKIFGSVSLLLIVLSSVNGNDDSYEGFKIYGVDLNTRADLELLKAAGDNLDLDFLSTSALHRNASVMVSPWNDEAFRTMLSKNDLTYRITQSNVQHLIDREIAARNIHSRKRRSAKSAKQEDTETMFDHFWTLEEIYQYLDDLKKQYPKLVRVADFGVTHEGRPIKVITISAKGILDQRTPVVLIDGGIHAREWAGHMSVLYLIHQLVERSAENMDLLKNTNWVIMPVANPDGYVYTHKSNRLWRKNRAPVNVLCIGTDLNRNFPFQWSFYGGECSNGYAGQTPASELETRAIMLMMAKYAHVTKVYLAVHTCGDYILYPYGYGYVDAPNKAQLQELGDKAAAAVKAIGGPEYAVGSASVLLYPANGSDDYIYGSSDVEYSYTLELSCGANSDAFIVSLEEMQSINKHAFEMFKVFGTFAGEQTVTPLSATSGARQSL
ncbi:carboxypeptidase B-like [Armigeres subalbatus]|uniref:carboxypeptidase B-like n=1 Tax=Armigeres subalbatus TaxID=124917 RepID=UPI002ED52E2E